MTSKAIVFFAAMALLALAPAASANDHGAPGPDPHVRLVAEFALGADHYYVVEDHGAYLVYRETNAVRFGGVDGSGVQPAWSCVAGASLTYVYEDETCASGTKTPPDEQVTNAGLIEAAEEALPEPVGELLHEIEHELL